MMKDAPRPLAFIRKPPVDRNRFLKVAEAAIPVLQEALALGNASLLRAVFEALGTVAADGDALSVLKKIDLEGGKVIPFPERARPRP